MNGDTIERLLIIDASLNPRIAALLRNQRLRMALSCRDLRVERFNDRALLRFLHSYWPDTILVTADDQMPREHGDLIAGWNHTLAVIDPVKPKVHEGGDTWDWEIVHRWVHNMQTQPPGTIYRYNARGRRLWTKPRKKRMPQLQPPPAPTATATHHAPTTVYPSDYDEKLPFEEE